jgi:uncharacterized protein DUF4382
MPPLPTMRGLVSVLGLLALGACEGTGPAYVPVSLRIKDDPTAHVASAHVWISRAYLVKAGEGGGEPRFTISDQPQSYDLLLLQNGVTALLGTATIPVGDYAQLRLVVDSARVTLAAGATFSDGSTERLTKVPSGMQTGIKVTFGGPIHLAPGQQTVVVDFPVGENFVFQGPAASPNGVLFRPTLHGTVQ